MRYGTTLSLLAVLAALASILPEGAKAAPERTAFVRAPNYIGILPACGSAWMLATIRYQFAQKEGRFWNSALHIRGFDRIRETAYRPWAAETLPRRFCSAIAHISDGISRPLHYSIGAGLGMIGAGPGVTWCVNGLDRNWAYNPDCRTARP